MSTPPPRRRRDAMEKAAAIERAATDLVLEHGYDAVTVDMVCELAGVSQRTFFNHFRTKDAALLGLRPPEIDERAAREFVVSTGPLLSEAARLIRVDPGALGDDPAQLARRIRAVGSSPTLMARQMDRVQALEGEVREIVLLRLRAQYPGEDEADLRGQADLATQLAMGVMRFAAHSWAEQADAGEIPVTDPAAIERLLGRLVEKLSSA
ncbi:TetR/AcrR family transcriptional regulator [Nocardiopsis sp. NPDC057823]|uniref:TetR/AcrR family transcriptional regulator n=1 Tax=Nocardiopsis sp. NPDC057823 TaxID=3346256 RepID=UPI00366D0538